MRLSNILQGRLPTIAAAGVPGYEATALAGFFAPASTPNAIIQLLNRETIRILSGMETKERLLNAGVEAISSTPGQFSEALQRDMAKWGKVIRDAGIRE
jgi:tripartite-type tricarboxylate transporter receptor subunit TctC